MSLFHDYIEIKTREIDAMEESGALLASIHIWRFIKPSTTWTSINLFNRESEEAGGSFLGVDTRDINTQHAKVSMAEICLDSTS